MAMRGDRGRGGGDPRLPLGRAGEEVALGRLERAGLVPVARNVRLCGAEIDLVLLDGDTVVFVEVRSRSRSDRGGPLATVGRAKQARIARAAAAFLARAGWSERPVRFDVVGVEWRPGGPRIAVVRGAFESPW